MSKSNKDVTLTITFQTLQNISPEILEKIQKSVQERLQHECDKIDNNSQISEDRPHKRHKRHNNKQSNNAGRDS